MKRKLLVLLVFINIFVISWIFFSVYISKSLNMILMYVFFNLIILGYLLSTTNIKAIRILSYSTISIILGILLNIHTNNITYNVVRIIDILTYYLVIITGISLPYLFKGK